MSTTNGMAIAVLALLTTTAAAAPPCPAEGAARVTVRLEMAPATLRTDLDRSALSALAGGMATGGVAIGGHRGEVMGLTVANFAVEYESESTTQPVGTGHWCARLSRVDARLFIPETTVYVAADYGKDSCAYDRILAHEHQHVAITEAALKSAGPRLEARLNKVAKESALGAGEPAAAEAALDESMARTVREFMAMLSEQTRRANLGIDTQANYRKVAANCRVW